MILFVFNHKEYTNSMTVHRCSICDVSNTSSVASHYKWTSRSGHNVKFKRDPKDSNSLVCTECYYEIGDALYELNLDDEKDKKDD